MTRDSFACLRSVFLAALACVPLISLAAEEAPPKYALFVAVQAPHAANRATLQKMLEREGYAASVEGDDELVMVLTEGELRDLFHARVRVRTVAASASDRKLAQPVLESEVIPARFRKLIRRVYFDAQRS